MPQISVIVPVYQAEACINQCIKSILAQSYANFELILVDDGSTDNSGLICEEFSRQDDRVRVIHKKNGGVSSARNAGLKIAQGTYITFVDSDDYVAPDYLQVLANHDCDMAICGSVTYYENGSMWSAVPNGNGAININAEQLLNWFENKFLFTVWGKAFSRELLNEHHISFRENVCYGEDTIFVLSAMDYCSRIWIEPRPSYHYVKCDVNSLSRRFSEKQVVSADLVDRFVGQWLSTHGVFSSWYQTQAYPTKMKIRGGFYSIFEDKSMPLHKKIKWYRLFFSLTSFRQNVGTLFPEFSLMTRKILERGSPCLFLAYEMMSYFRR